MKNLPSCPGFRAVKLLLLALILSLCLTGCGLPFRQKSGATGVAASKTARDYLGAPYVYGGQTPKGFDCSGLTSYVYKKHGVKLPRSSVKQAQAGRPVRKKNLKPGDLVFFKTGRSARVSHVGIYIGNDKFIHAPGTGKKVTTASLSSNYYKRTYHSARRVV